jgi:hypothetical protein
VLKGKIVIIPLVIFSLLISVPINQYVNAQLLPLSSTSTNLTINPTTVYSGDQATVTATVSDTTFPVNIPSGTVTFSDNNAGGIFGTVSCTTSNNMLVCTVIYTSPSTSGTVTITGTYSGDLTHNTSSGEASLSVIITIPEAPTGLVAIVVSTSQIDLSWNAPDDGGSAITGYQIERSTDGGSTWIIVSNTTSAATTYSDVGLEANITYHYRASAINSVGTSLPSNTATATTSIQSTEITVYAHRVPASYWDPCFAATCDAGTGPGASMYFGLYNSSGELIREGFADEHGYTFSSLNPNETYFVYPADCGFCHISLHDVVFEYWEDTQTNERPRATTVGAHLHAWYSCSNSCS